MKCEQINDEFAELYLRAELSDADQEAFERHYFECARCFDDLETYRALRRGLEKTARVSPAAFAARGSWSHWKWAAAAASVVLAIALSSLLPQTPLQRTTPEPPEVTGASPPAAPGAPPAVEQSAPEVDVPSLTELAHVLPPGYTTAVMRGVPDDATRRFREAMQRYVRGDYAGALSGLRAAASLDADAPDIAFFLGICSLLTGEPEAAIAQLRRTIALGESPYLEEARFYLAKAYLRRGELQAAESELRKTVQLRGDREKEARELLQNVEALRKR